MNRFSWYVHGLWILGAIFMFLAAMIAGNIEWVEGTTLWSYWLAILISFALFLLSGVSWISAAANSLKEERIYCSHCHHVVEERHNHYREMHKRSIE